MCVKNLTGSATDSGNDSTMGISVHLHEVFGAKGLKNANPETDGGIRILHLGKNPYQPELGQSREVVF